MTDLNTYLAVLFHIFCWMSFRCALNSSQSSRSMRCLAFRVACSWLQYKRQKSLQSPVLCCTNMNIQSMLCSYVLTTTCYCGLTARSLPEPLLGALIWHFPRLRAMKLRCSFLGCDTIQWGSMTTLPPSSPWRWRQQGRPSKTMVCYYITTWHHKTEDHDLNLHNCETFKSHITKFKIARKIVFTV